MMSADFDYWEFVCCARCYLPVSIENGPTVPFWLTECGHVICNNHLKSDQSCAKCGATQIQVTPLQQDMDAPMSDWFRPVPSSLDSITFAVKFQQDSMASQIRYYKTKYQRQKMLTDQFKKANEALAAENADLRQSRMNYNPYEQQKYQDATAQYMNVNGKRPMTRGPERPTSTASSSVRSGGLGGPERLTIPSNQHPPPLRQDQKSPTVQYASVRGTQPTASARPGTSMFQERFGYINESQGQMRPQPLTEVQAAPRAKKQKMSSHQIAADRSMPPPHLPSTSEGVLDQLFVPPPTPQHRHPLSHSFSTNKMMALPSVPSTSSMPSKRNKFMPPSTIIQESHNNNRFVPATPSRRFVPPDAVLQRAMATTQPSGVSQRKPFMPKGQG